MDLDEVVGELVERDGGSLVFQFAAEGIRQLRVPAKAHVHAQILPSAKLMPVCVVLLCHKLYAQATA